MAACLLEQLCICYNHIPACLKGRYARGQPVSTKDLDLYLKAVTELAQDRKDGTIIIDGWDEDNLSPIRDFKQALDELQRLPWKLYITSRKKPARSFSVGNPILLEVKKDDNTEDVRRFVEHALERSSSSAPAHEFLREISLKEDARRALVQGASGR
jgi:hypothetical protein